MPSPSASFSLCPGAVIGTIHSEGSLKHAKRLKPGAVDLLEVRVDAFAGGGEEALRKLRVPVEKLDFPLVITVRDPQEGGAQEKLSLRERLVLHREFLGLATLIDLELRNAPRAKSLIHEAREMGREVVLSYHDFRRTPSLATLKKRASEAIRHGATVFKVATTTTTPSDLATLVSFLAEATRSRALGQIRYAVMGMGEFGKVSRLALARCGSVLNYGYLHQVQVPGQWPAALLKERIAELEQQA